MSKFADLGLVSSYASSRTQENSTQDKTLWQRVTSSYFGIEAKLVIVTVSTYSVHFFVPFNTGIAKPNIEASFMTFENDCFARYGF